MKAICQPHRTAIKGTAIGATMAPILVPELNIPVARALSRLGNHSATVLMEAGKFADSPTPSMNRQKLNPAAELANA